MTGLGGLAAVVADWPSWPEMSGLARVWKGKELVANKRAQLGKGRHVLHSIRVGDNSSDIDHLVVWPAGVFS